MGTLLQLAALPAACMLIAWMRAGGAQAIAALLGAAVALIARRDAVRARLAASAVKPPADGRSVAALAAAMQAAWPKLARAARHPKAPNTFAIVSPGCPVRRIRRFPALCAGACRVAA
jgi:hypothetical protein